MLDSIVKRSQRQHTKFERIIRKIPLLQGVVPRLTGIALRAKGFIWDRHPGNQSHARHMCPVTRVLPLPEPFHPRCLVAVSYLDLDPYTWQSKQGNPVRTIILWPMPCLGGWFVVGRSMKAGGSLGLTFANLSCAPLPHEAITAATGS